MKKLILVLFIVGCSKEVEGRVVCGGDEIVADVDNNGNEVCISKEKQLKDNACCNCLSEKQDFVGGNICLIYPAADPITRDYSECVFSLDAGSKIEISDGDKNSCLCDKCRYVCNDLLVDDRYSGC